jgi:hypothetical protein
MPTTPGGIVYPSPTDSPDVPRDLQALAESVEDIFDLEGDWTAYTPALTASTTSPTLGTGSAQVGRYMRLGNTLWVKAKVQFGTAGAAAGSGTYRLGLPFPVLQQTGSVLSPHGTVVGVDNSAAVHAVGIVNVNADGDTFCLLRYQAAASPSALAAFTNAAPWTWAASDRIEVEAVFECA